MKRLATPTALVAMGLSLSGCVTDGTGILGPNAYAPPPVALAAPENPNAAVPWQLTPASTASVAAGESTTIQEMAGYGQVKGTAKALSYLNTAMTPYPGKHVAVEPCTAAVERQVGPVGATKIESAAAGPDQHMRNGEVRSQVLFRIMYDRGGPVREVRQAALTCVVKGKRLISAKMA